jgi:GAF domain-containing protein
MLDVSREEYSIRSMLCVAIYPKTGDAYMFGLHQCSYERIWTEDEKTLFEAIGRRLADGLTSLVAYRDLRDPRRTAEHPGADHSRSRLDEGRQPHLSALQSAV